MEKKSKFFTRTKAKLWRKTLKFYASSKRKVIDINKREYSDETQKTVAEMVKKIISKPDSELLYATPSGKRYVEYKDFMVKMIDTHGGGSVKIIDKKCLYEVFLPEIYYRSIQNSFDAKIEFRRKIMEKKIDSNTREVLKAMTLEIETL